MKRYALIVCAALGLALSSGVARAGVTTVLSLSGQMSDVLDGFGPAGAGINGAHLLPKLSPPL